MTEDDEVQALADALQREFSDVAPSISDVRREVRDARERYSHARVRQFVPVLRMASPIDAIPDVIPVIGMADDVILTYLVLRSVARVAGNDVLQQHWRGSPEGFAVLEHLLGLDHHSTRSERAHPPSDNTN
ncbi:MAG TPA: DUF1232 domain-containing protein [Acidimicrobiia bacterium]